MWWLIWLAPRWTYNKGRKYVGGKEGKDVVSFLLCAHGNEVMVYIKNNLINFFYPFYRKSFVNWLSIKQGMWIKKGKENK